MLDPKYLSEAPEDVAKYFDELETRILEDVARRIAENGYMMTSTAEYQMRKLEELGVTMNEIERYISETLHITEQKVKSIIMEASYRSIEKDNEMAKATGVETPHPNLTQAILSGIVSTNNELRNICNSMASAANKAFEQALDQAYLSVSSGAFSLGDAVKMAVNDLAKNGISWIDYPTGTHRRADSAIRNALRTGINQTAARCQEKNLDEMGCNMVETTSHMGARPDHAVWQGKVFWRKEPVKGLENFYFATGYGTGAGLCGWNCRHNFFPNFDGKPSFKHYDEEENRKQYELDQQQRYNERKIREWKRRQAVNKAGKVDYTREARKVSEWQQRQRQLLKNHPDMKRNYAREAIEHRVSGLSANRSDDRYQNNTIIKRGQLTVMDTDTKIKVLKAYEKRLVTLDHERAVVISDSGAVYEVIGSSGHVHPEILGDEQLRNAFVTHNHPINETEYTFSKDDVKAYMDYEMLILRGVDNEYEYQISGFGKTEVDADETDYFKEKNVRHAMTAIDCRKKGLIYWRKKR